MRYLILLVLILAGCNGQVAKFLGPKPSESIPKRVEAAKEQVKETSKLAEDNKKAVSEIKKNPAPEVIETQVNRVEKNSDAQIQNTKIANQVLDEILNEMSVVKKIEKKADDNQNKVQDTLFKFAGLMAGVVVITAVAGFKVKELWWISGGAAILALGALILREWWTQFLICSLIIFLSGLAVVGWKIFQKIKSGRKNENVLSEVVSVVDLAKKKIPGELRETLFGDTGLFATQLTHEADEVIAEIRGKDGSSKVG